MCSCRQASLLSDFKQVRGNKNEAVDCASFFLYISKVLSVLVAQIDVDFVKISCNVFILVFGMFGRLKMCKLVTVYPTWLGIVMLSYVRCIVACIGHFFTLYTRYTKLDNTTSLKIVFLKSLFLFIHSPATEVRKISI